MDLLGSEQETATKAVKTTVETTYVWVNSQLLESLWFFEGKACPKGKVPFSLESLPPFLGWVEILLSGFDEGGSSQRWHFLIARRAMCPIVKKGMEVFLRGGV